MVKTMKVRIHLLLLMLQLLETPQPISSIGSESKHPVLWRESSTPITTGHKEFKLIIKFISPCIVINANTIHPDLLPIALERCESMFQTLYMGPLETMCPTGTYLEIKENLGTRQKRELVTLLVGIIIATYVVPIGLGIAGTAVGSSAIHKGKNLQAQIDHLTSELDRKSDEISEALKAIKIINSNMHNMTAKINELDLDLNSVKNYLTPSQYSIAHVISKLYDLETILRTAHREWKQNRLYAPLLDIWNITLPCGDNCPVHFARPVRCALSPKRDEIFLTFTAPIINTNLTLAEADAFVFFTQQNNQTCSIVYNGPTNAIISTTQHCIHSINIQKSDIVLTSPECKSQTALPNPSTFYTIDKCYPSTKEDYKNYVQVKYYQQEMHIYCFKSNISIGKTVSPCPPYIFELKEKTNFSINNNAYQYGKYEIHQEQRQDDAWPIAANTQLQPTLQIKDIVLEFQERKKAENKAQSASESTDVALIITCTIMGLVLLTITIITIFFCVQKINLTIPIEMRNRNQL